MDDDLVLGARARRAIPVIAAAVAVVIVLSLLYVRPVGERRGVVLRIPTVSSLDQQFWPAFDFVTPSLGWAAVVASATHTVLVYRTTDGAKRWQRLFAATVSEPQYPAIHFFDRNHGLFYAGRLYRTSDGGSDWEVISLPDGTPNFTFASQTLGWAVDTTVPSRSIYTTRDGGLTWRRVGPAPDSLYGGKGGFGLFDFRADGEAWTGVSSALPTVYATFDGGVSWHPVALPVPHIPVTNPVPGKPFLPEFTTLVRLLPGSGVLVQIDSPGGSSGFISLDRGVSWTPITLPPSPAFIADVSFVDARHWWASRWSFLFKTSDAGRTWQSVHAVVPDYLGDWQFDAAQVIDSRHAWLTMRSQSIKRPTGLAMSADGGASWNSVDVPQPG
jgi:photosystem II stability/assembly factor-like uncharacterized protein